jgi:phage terminase large subunit-like protein
MTVANLSKAQARIELAAKAQRYRREHRREFPPKWYEWQKDFFAASRIHSRVMCLAGNRTGKTLSSTFAFAVHCTGQYPEGWQGRRFPQAVTAWALGVSNQQLRDVLQRELLGDLRDDGTITGGWIHPDEVVRISRSQTPGLVSEVVVRHASGGESRVSLRAYTQAGTGQSTLPFAGSSVDVILVDEQPPDEIDGQLVTRTMTGDGGRGGLLLYSMTPELGLTRLVQHFLEQRAPHECLVGPIAWSQCGHLTPKRQAEILAGIPEHEREMRSKGVPFFGSGLVFPIGEERLKVEPFPIPEHFRVLRGLDIGIDHPTALAWVAFDPEGDIVYVVRTYRQAGEIVAAHAAAANAQWSHAPLVVPHDADQREKGSGETVKALYEAAGIAETLSFANPDGSRFVEPGIMAMYERMRTDRFKVFSTCREWWDEFRKYHRKDGKLVKVDDDCISAVRYAAQMVAEHGVSVKEQAPQFFRHTGSGFGF